MLREKGKSVKRNEKNLKKQSKTKRQREREKEEREHQRHPLSFQISPRSYAALFPGSRSTPYASTISLNPLDAAARSASEAPGGSLSGCELSAAPRKAAEISRCDAVGATPSVE